MKDSLLWTVYSSLDSESLTTVCQSEHIMPYLENNTLDQNPINRDSKEYTALCLHCNFQCLVFQQLCRKTNKSNTQTDTHTRDKYRMPPELRPPRHKTKVHINRSSYKYLWTCQSKNFPVIPHYSWVRWYMKFNFISFKFYQLPL